ncbi:MAG TPA: efflux RND transporter periplasmic adaptor subunit [Gammaproteobacteria bacterium]|nr:efflux RND transporter periplasmic adaptor subunit [Gammaproteobacteria bacterium]
MNKKLLGLAAIVAAVVAVPLLRAVVGGEKAKEVQTETVSRHAIQSSVLASGHLQHEEQVKLTTEEIGRVTQLFVDEGDEVKQGELLLQIDDQAYRAAVEQNKAQVQLQQIAIERQQVKLANVQQQWERQRMLHEKGLIDQNSFDAATNELDLAKVDLEANKEQLSQAKAQLEQAEDRLRKTRVYAPIDGVVTSLDIKVGETAIASSTNIPGSSLMTIANPASIHTEVNVDEADIANVAIGQHADVFAIAYPDRPIKGVIDSIAVSAKVPEGSQTRSFAVKIRLDAPEGVELRPGMSCRAEIYTTIKETLAVPIQAVRVAAVQNDANKNTYSVFVMRDGRAHKTDVEVGLSDDTYQEVTKGLEEGDVVVVGPDRILRSLADGDAVAAAPPVVADEPRS